MEVALKAAFGGVRWLPWWMAFSHSNLAPKLDLHDEDFEYRVIVSNRRRYEEIESVDFRKSIGTRDIRLKFKTSSSTFSGNVVDDDEARRALAFMRDKGCALTERALGFLATP